MGVTLHNFWQGCTIVDVIYDVTLLGASALRRSLGEADTEYASEEEVKERKYLLVT